MAYVLHNSQSTPGAIVLSVTYGIDVQSIRDPFLGASLDASHALASAMVPGKFLVDIIPIREHICAETVTHK